MTIKDAIKSTEGAGTTVTKDKLIDVIKRSSDKLFPFAYDASGKYAIVRVPW